MRDQFSLECDIKDLNKLLCHDIFLICLIINTFESKSLPSPHPCDHTRIRRARKQRRNPKEIEENEAIAFFLFSHMPYAFP